MAFFYAVAINSIATKRFVSDLQQLQQPLAIENRAF